MESEAVIEESDQVNEHGRYQDCVVARCIVTDEEAMAWGTSERSIKRALRELTERCECGADWHSEAE